MGGDYQLGAALDDLPITYIRAMGGYIISNMHHEVQIYN